MDSNNHQKSTSVSYLQAYPFIFCLSFVMVLWVMAFYRCYSMVAISNNRTGDSCLQLAFPLLFIRQLPVMQNGGNFTVRESYKIMQGQR